MKKKPGVKEILVLLALAWLVFVIANLVLSS